MSEPSEKKGANKSLLKASGTALTGRASVAIFSLLFVAYLARDLPPSTLGLIALHAIFVMSSKVLLELGLSFAVMREAGPLVKVGDVDGAVDQIIGVSTGIRMMATLLFALAYGGAGLFFIDSLSESFPGVDLSLVVPFGAAHLFAKNAQFVLSPVLMVKDRFGSESALDSAAALLEKTGAVTCYWTLGIDWFFAGMFFGQVVTTGATALIVRDVIRRFRPRQLRASAIRGVVKRYWPLFLRTLFRQGMRQADRLLIAALVSAEALAVLHVARQGSTYLRYVARAFVDPLNVRLAEATDRETRLALVRTTQRVLAVVPLIVMLFSPLIMRAIGGPQYADDWPLLTLLCASYVFYGLSEVQLAIIAMLGHGKEPVRMDALAGVLGLVATGVCVTYLGDLGMAFGQLVSYLALYLGGLALAKAVWSAAHSESASTSPSA